MDAAQQHDCLHRLLGAVRTASLSTIDQQGAPYGSMVPYLWYRPDGALIIHISGLAQHTRNLHRDGRAALLVTETDGPELNPLALVRATFTGTLTGLPPDDPLVDPIRAAYLHRFATAQRVMQLADFVFYRLRPQAIHLVAGFGQAHRMDGAVIGP